MPAKKADEMTIDELARRTGLTVRNIRAHQSRGLLQPPEVRGRTGFYGPDHVARIQLITEMQAEGYNLDLIRRLLEGAGGQSDQVLRFTRALREPFSDEEPEVVDAADMAQRWRTQDPKLLEDAVKLGFLHPIGEGRFELLSPRLGRAGERLAELGVDAKESLAILARVRRHADSVAKTFVDVFLESVWKPFEAEGRPEERWPEISSTVEELRPIATEALVAIFQQAMNDTVEKSIGRELQHASDGKGRRSRR
ncbi:MAG: MerR family transcriptional regulator [Actinomycetota bacterium]|nr:MerR family transcriptional regulator [Actinomycetota bacterium]